MENLEIIFEDIFNPVIQDNVTANDNCETFAKILKMTENL